MGIDRSTGKACIVLAAAMVLQGCSVAASTPLRGTGDLGLVVERAAGSVQLVETSGRSVLATIPGLGDLSHASIVYSRDGRYGYVFGRDGGLTKVDLLEARIAKRVVRAGNSIGGAISQDGRLVASSNYKPGGVQVFDADSLELVADIPAVYDDTGRRSKVVGLVDAPGQRFVFSLYEAGEIWIADLSDTTHPEITRYRDVGRLPYDALITPDGRYYIAGLFGEDGLVLVDLWHPEQGTQKILQGYGRGQRQLPVYKMPHLEGWAITGDLIFLPAVGHHEVLVMNRNGWHEIDHIAVYGQPVFAMAQPDGRRIWVNFAPPLNDTVQVIDVATRRIVKTLKPGTGVLHMEFTPRGEHVWLSVRDRDQVQVYDTRSMEQITSLPSDKPSGIFFTSRAAKIGL